MLYFLAIHKKEAMFVMPYQPNIRKQVYDLSVQDLLEVPAWEYASDEESVPGQDEATVRPYLTRPIDPADGTIIVRANFELAEGSRFLGYVHTAPLVGTWDLGGIAPVIIAEGGQVSFWLGAFPKADRVHRSLDILNKLPTQIFPVGYRSDVPILTGEIAGAVAGFSFRQGDRVGIFSV